MDKNNINWQMLQQIIMETAGETIGKADRTERNKWYDKCKEATRNRNEAYHRMIQKHYTRGAEQQYKEMREMRRIEKILHRKKKREYYDEQTKQVENLHTQKKSRRLYQLINNIRKDFRPYMKACRANNGQILNETSALMNRWKQHF
jgi:alpha-galactosidase/6-phospho-beta-glucosidase family protein